MKTCPICKQKKTLDNYSKRKRRGRVDEPVSYCKPCQVKKDLLKRRKSKQKFLDYKGGKCEFCGYDKCPSALEFHHKNPDEKEFSISRKRSLSAEVKKELDQCLLLCAVCHREEHWRLSNLKIGLI